MHLALTKSSCDGRFVEFLTNVAGEGQFFPSVYDLETRSFVPGILTPPVGSFNPGTGFDCDGNYITVDFGVVRQFPLQN